MIDRNGTSARWDGKILNTVSTPLTPCSTGLADTESNDAISVLGGCDEIDAEQLCPHVMQAGRTGEAWGEYCQYSSVDSDLVAAALQPIFVLTTFVW